MPDKIDILNRKSFIDNLTRVTRQLADNHKGCAFAVDGRWGSGKSYILDAFEEEIGLFQDPAAAGDRYIVFRYNCWQYDYYDEPAIAIIAAIRDAAEKYQSILPKVGPSVKAMLEVVKDLGVDLISNVIETKFGWSPEQIVELYKNYKEKKGEVKEQVVKSHPYDTFFEFKTVLDKTREQLAKMASDKPIIILVDELDRCIPEYAIKVLERLHHLFENQPNIVVILAYDQLRLNHAIKNIYGIEADDVSHFMKKFVSFSMQLDTGDISDSFWVRYKDYLDYFDVPDSVGDKLLEELPQKLFAGIDVRTQEKIMERTAMLHKMIFDDPCDLSVLYYEMLHEVLSYRNPDSNINAWIVNLNSTTVGGLERILGIELYEYLKMLEKNVCDGKVVVFGGSRSSYNVLQATPLALTFLYLAATEYPIEGAYCHHYALQEQMCTEEIQNVIDLVKQFDRFSKLIL